MHAWEIQVNYVLYGGGGKLMPTVLSEWYFPVTAV